MTIRSVADKSPAERAREVLTWLKYHILHADFASCCNDVGKKMAVEKAHAALDDALRESRREGAREAIQYVRLQFVPPPDEAYRQEAVRERLWSVLAYVGEQYANQG